MKGRIGALVLALLAIRAGAEEEKRPSCVTHCHGAEATAFTGCVHEGQLTCMDCHGGNPAAHRDKAKAHDPAHGYTGKVSRVQVPDMCARCHSDPIAMHPYGLSTDQMAHYRSSRHGIAHARGDLSTAVCTDCHGVHRILPAHDPEAPTARVNQPETCGKCHSDPSAMKAHGLPADSVARFREGVHGVALLEERARGAPSCSDCHGAHGANPPGVGGIVEVCSHCHAMTAEQYRRSPHGKPAATECKACHDETGHAYRSSGCASCHGAHAIAAPGSWMYEGDEVGRCGHCHRDDPQALEVTNTIVDGRLRLIRAMARTRRAIHEAKDRGLFLEDEKVYLRESERTLVFLGPLVHGLDTEAIEKHLADGRERQNRTLERIDKKAQVLRDRRLLLSGLAFLLLLFVALLATKLRAIRELS